MKLDADTIKYINKVIKTAQLVGIDEIIIEPGMVRAMDADQSVVMIQDEDVPNMVFGAIGLNRISTYMTRYEVARTQDNFTMEVVTDDNGEFARSITMKGKGVKIDYRAANPTTIKAPKGMKDVPGLYEVEVNGEAVAMFQKGLAAMSCENVTVICNDGVSFDFVDDNNDNFTYQFADSVTELQPGVDAKWAHKYPAKVLLSMFKHDSGATIVIGKAGTLTMAINGLNVTVLPKV